MEYLTLSFLVFFLLDHFTSGVSLDTLGRSSVFPFFGRSDLDDPSVDSAADTVLHFDVELGDDVLLESSVFLEILLGRGVDDIPDGEPLDGLVLGAESAAVDADDGFHVPPVVFVPSLISSLLGHCGYKVIFIFILN